MFPKSKKSQQQDTSDNQSSTELANRGLSLKELEQEMRESRLADRASTFRPTGETAEEKRARKKAVKEERKVISAGNSGFLLLNLSRSYVQFGNSVFLLTSWETWGRVGGGGGGGGLKKYFWFTLK